MVLSLRVACILLCFVFGLLCLVCGFDLYLLSLGSFEWLENCVVLLLIVWDFTLD